MNSNWIDIRAAHGDTFSAHLALPPLGRGPGIVLVQEIWGVNAHIRAVAQQYALAGYVVLAPDIFWRIEPHIELNYDQAGSARAFELYGQVDTALAAADVAATIAHLHAMPELDGKVATLGFCLGGQLAYRGGAEGGADAIVSYYGGGIAEHLDIAASIAQPALFHHGSRDAHITPEQVAAIKAAFAGKSNAQFFDYAEGEHGFNCWGRPAYRQREAALAQGRTLQFLAQHL
ncbi:MAG: dienelactone hydrolase family protein [Paludibacterium sp.]|uniref:dienelactone hydrolase family protein n=1 Tax=Paludibacterium sp. TaxID=1917523 RepID=UPI0025F03F50|nr:dienelactone hydrolase family protein [Paludibacterium sp.]MBV8046513.1 dienelactone hydrolase family protein [Paludibacterium sp.]MBV8648895.1 dienelactone hydrolase family protein [Paludibacterium sp.]